jgi:transketolase
MSSLVSRSTPHSPRSTPLRPLPTAARHDSIRGWFAYELYNQMVVNDRIWVLTGDLGYRMLDRIRADFPYRFVNCGAAEQAMIGIAVGLAQEGMIPFVYSITPFLLFRPFETIRNYIHHEKAPVRLVGSGTGHDYFHDGYSHWPEEEHEIMRTLKGIDAHWPRKKSDIPILVKRMVREHKPWYLNLRR